ncbi:ADP-ribosylglycohydrolase family protein [Sandaracinus amylolyticus]|uniref:ADP-ribosylglycohydrolase family protein n=1 Tax=Sandaracinus amylolyticus TaxID=927083 RepID=UPI001F32BA70|nr:ADP-ribosylglycohydrolase family protein [Sandaracinus amylolyticus]UJR85422.1 Hypothetical protein I5071_75020 [Sandaracinus amylolyticus]
MISDHDARIARARVALDGLSIGDAFGERFFDAPETIDIRLAYRAIPSGTWRWTDDTHMALSVVDELGARGTIDPTGLAARFAERFARDPWRGYGAMARRVLTEIGEGTPWDLASGAIFDGAGSKGNGAAMRVAPIGAYFAGDLDRVIDEARRSALPTHAHPEGIAGAIAIAVLAAIAVRREERPTPSAIIAEVASSVPPGETRARLEQLVAMPHLDDVRTIASIVGNGTYVLAEDTVPLSVWCAARHLDDFVDAMWTTVSALGDRDTTCAIVGGVVALAAPATVPAEWRAAREPIEGV